MRDEVFEETLGLEPIDVNDCTRRIQKRYETQPG